MLFEKNKLSKKTKFKDFVCFWQNNIANLSYSPVTNFKNSSNIKTKLLPILGEKRLEDITPIIIQEFYSNLCSSKTNYKNVENSYLQSNTIKRIIALLSSILQSAVDLKIIEYNPCRGVKLNFKMNNYIQKYNYYSVETYHLVLTLLKKEPLIYQVIIELALKTGLRKSEIFGLTYLDIDFENQTITVNKTRNYIAGQGMIEKSTKTKSSNRIISVSEKMLDKLKLLINNNCDNKYIFENTNFNTISLWFKNWQIKNKIEPIITFHDLRHTHATLLLSQGVDVKTISARLGHTSISTTLNIYTHALEALDKRAAEKLEEI